MLSKLKAMNVRHYALLLIGPAIAAVSAYQAESHATLVVAGISVLGVLTTAKALFMAVPDSAPKP